MPMIKCMVLTSGNPCLHQWHTLGVRHSCSARDRHKGDHACICGSRTPLPVTTPDDLDSGGAA